MTKQISSSTKNESMHKKNVISRSNQRPFLWLLPLLSFLFLFFLLPCIDVIRTSFTNASMTSTDYKYTLNSYIRVFQDPSFLNVLWITLFFVAVSVVFQFVFGFAIALAVDHGEKKNMYGTVLTRTISLISWAIPGVAIGIIWKLLYSESQSGILNYLLTSMGFHSIAFLTNPFLALIFMTLANVWRGTAQSMILLYAGLKTVSIEVIEASDVDGAGPFRKILSIIVPSMKSVIMINILLNIINTFNTFDMIMSLTGGGPGRSTEVLVLSSYRTIFQQLDLGKGSAIAVVLLVINIVFASLYIRANREEN
ncbi:MAG TPA: sugar ABC transporter permease [Ruminiclostridium sp.]